jgi:putative effector of murein hydrolase LrgA (UPF0299 family)
MPPSIIGKIFPLVQLVQLSWVSLRQVAPTADLLLKSLVQLVRLPEGISDAVERKIDNTVHIDV